MVPGQEAPRAVTAMGGRYAGIKDNREIPDTLEVIWEFRRPTLVIFTQINANAAPGNPVNSEMEVRGTKGTMYINYADWHVVPERVSSAVTGYAGGKGYGNPVNRDGGKLFGAGVKPAMSAPPPVKGGAGYDTESHARNFLDCVKSRGKCNADILTGHLSTAATLIGNIAHRTRSFLEWDAKAERFTNNEAANKYLSYKYRAPYKLG